jgi:hypothetical protein
MGHGSRSPKSRSPRGTDAVAAAAGTPVSESSLDLPPVELSFPRSGVGSGEGMDAQFQAIWDKNIKSASGDLFQSVKKPIEGLVRDVAKQSVAALDKRMANVEEGIDKLTTGQGQLQKAVESLTAELREAKDKYARSPPVQMSGSANGSPGAPPNVTHTGFFRATDPTILFCNVAGGIKVSRAKFHDSIMQLATETETGACADHFDVVGDLLDCLFEIKWKGGAATKRCLEFYQSLQLGRGKWKRQRVSDENDVEIQFYVQPDKNGCQIRREVFSKLLKDFVQEQLGQAKEVWNKKASGTLFVDKRRLLTVLITGEDSARIDWDHAKRIDLRLDQALVEEKVKALVLGGPGGSSS